MCVSHTAGCGVPDTTPAPEIMYKHAQGAQKGLTAAKKNKNKKIIIVKTLQNMVLQSKIFSDMQLFSMLNS